MAKFTITLNVILFAVFSFRNSLNFCNIFAWFFQGAAMHQSVLKCLSPAVILVEEAAEILEPNVLAVLNPNLQHLILIGDHEQLRPTVASYPLDRW